MTTAQDQQSGELLPCPFCGGAPETTGPWEIGVSDNYETCICCEKCGFHISSDDGFASGEKQSLAKAVDRWNRRAPAVQAARALPAGMEPAGEVTGCTSAGGGLNNSISRALPQGTKLYTAAQVLAMGRVPPGWQAVPVAPTAEMMLHNSGCQHHAHDDAGCSARQVRRKVWAHMLAAAPRPPAAQEQGLLQQFLQAAKEAGVERLNIPVERWCERCDMDKNWLTGRTRMALCPQCGNKRCPRATHHDNACTGSNEPGQRGSSWEHVQPSSASKPTP